MAISNINNNESGSSVRGKINAVIDATNYLIGVDTVNPIDFATSLTPDVASGLYRKTTLTGDITLNAPTGSVVDGVKWKCRFTADSSPHTLNIDAAIKVPSASTFTGSKVIAANEMWIVQLEYSSDLEAWILQVLEGGWNS